MRRAVTRRFPFVESLVVIAMVAVVVAVLFPFIAQAATGASVFIVDNGPACASDFCYAPANIRIRQARSVTWTNRSVVEHTVTRCTTDVCPGAGPGTGGDPAFSSGGLTTGQTFSVTFHKTGTYNYYCQIHGYALMHGTVTVLPFAVGTARLPDGSVGQAYSAKLTALGGKAPLHWSIASGRLPNGLALSTSGAISGTPTVTGTFSFIVKVTDSSTPALVAERALSITIG